MSTDVRRLRALELCRLLNSTPLGECLGERQLRRHRTRAGLGIAAKGDATRVDLLRYVAWLHDLRHAPGHASGHASGPSGGQAPDGESADYDAHRERARLRNALLSRSGRDVGPLPQVADPERRAAARLDFRRFCETYFARTFVIAWSEDHLRVIAKIERAVLEGGLFAMAMPRGSGKTSLCETACLWAVLYGHRDFVALIGSDEDHAEGMLASMRAELENNDLLLADFPEACHPVRALEGIHQRAAGQLCDGKPTQILWTAKETALPVIEGSPSSGAVIRVAGITGRVRGMKRKRADGVAMRPSLVLVDDPQTDESARSPTQCAMRERIVAGAILGLAGPGRKIAGLMTLTVVRKGDLADRLLDPARHPQWQGERTRMVYAFPRDEALWARYAEIRAEGLRSGAGISHATEFYRERRAAMDEGARVAWDGRFNPDELSALQHAMNLRLQDEAAFFAEYQNDPIPDVVVEAGELTVDAVLARANGLPRGVVPVGCQRVTMFVDVQQRALYWLAAAWADDFTGHVLDYGTEPEQDERRFSLRDLRRTLADAAPGAGLEGSIAAGIAGLLERTMGREWRCEDGSTFRVSRCLVDANWGNSTDVVYLACRRSPYAAMLLPSHGRYFGAASVPMSEYRRKAGERVGLNWRIPLAGPRAIRHVTFDTNWWKSFIAARMAVAPGDPGALTLFGGARDRHDLLAEHLTSECRVRTQGRGREVDEWRIRMPGADNHWLDCLVGSAVAASIEGSALPAAEARRGPRRTFRMSERIAARRAATR